MLSGNTVKPLGLPWGGKLQLRSELGTRGQYASGDFAPIPILWLVARGAQNGVEVLQPVESSRALIRRYDKAIEHSLMQIELVPQKVAQLRPLSRFVRRRWPERADPGLETL